LFGLKKYFQVHYYYENTKARISIFNLNGGTSIWWEELKEIKGLKERNITWKKLEKYLQKDYLSEKYYDDKIKEFREHKLGQITMDSYSKRFMDMLRYVPYLKDEKVRVKCFLNGLPQSYQDRIEFNRPRTLEDIV
jgi:hypothetical protein